VPYQPGEIVYAKICDPDGYSCAESHRAVIVSVNAAKAAVLIVGITSSFSSPHPWYWVELPHDPNGHSITGLTKPSVAKGDWFMWWSMAQVDPTGKHVPLDELDAIKSAVVHVLEKKKKGEPL
jgi:hypothetical protein